ncbi:MAG: CLC_0170 family protein [Cellulosilyticaceae bacterium]
MSVLMQLKEALSIPLVFTILGIGLYMAFLQSKSLDTVSHLERESKFTKIVGYVYIVIGIAAGILVMI